MLFDPREALALASAPKVNAHLFRALLNTGISLSDIRRDPSKEFSGIRLSTDTQDFLKNPPWDRIDRALAWIDSTRHLVWCTDPWYPDLLLEISSSPIALFVEGNPSLLKDPQIAMVGSRNPSPLGKKNAILFARDLAESQITVTSGLARGIDGLAHQAALDAQGRSVAVLGSGHLKLYPKEHQRLAETLSQEGAVVSEFFPDESPRAFHFPRRNRIISGLCLGVLVVEASLKSGSLITARFALNQNREVFAIPGPLHHPLSQGCHFLIKQGAKLVECLEDIRNELSSYFPTPTPCPSPTPPTNANPSDVCLKGVHGVYRMVLDSVGLTVTPVDWVIEISGLPTPEVLQALQVLEERELIFSVPGGFTRSLGVSH